MNAEPVEAAACGFFYWSAWGGSPQLVAHVARVAQQAVQHSGASQEKPTTYRTDDGPPEGERRARDRPLIRVTVDGDNECFTGPQDFVEFATPEAKRNFDEIEIEARDATVATRLCFRRRANGRQRSGVHLAVWSVEAGGAEAAGIIAQAVRRGFRRFVGVTKGSANLGLDRRARVVVLCAPVISVMAPFAVGIAAILAFITFVRTLFPHAHLPSVAYTCVCLAIGLAFPFAWQWYVQDVELAAKGQTRLAASMRRAVITIGSLVLATTVKVLLHG